MKLVTIIGSETMFNLLAKMVEKNKELPDASIKRVQSTTELEDAIEFFKGEIYVLDPQLPEGSNLQKVLEANQVPFLLIGDDVKEIVPKLVERFGIPPEEIDISEEVENERIIYRNKIIEKEIITKQYQSLPSKVIIVGSLTKGSGSTILATNLARMVGERKIDVAYMEHPLIKPYMYDYLQIHTSDHEYTDVTRAVKVKNANLKEEPFIQDNVRWHVIDATEYPMKDFEYHHLLMATHAIGANVLIVDISDRWEDPEIQQFMRHADLILMAAEPDIIKYEYARLEYRVSPSDSHPTREYRIMKYLEENHINKYEIVLMKYFKGVHMETMNQILHRRPIAMLPYIEYPVIIKAMQNFKLLYDFDNSSKELLEENFLRIISRFMPNDLVQLKTERKGLLSKLIMKK